MQIFTHDAPPARVPRHADCLSKPRCALVYGRTVNDVFRVDLVVIWRKKSTADRWRPGPVLYRDPANVVHEHQRSVAPLITDTPTGDFHYIWRRFVDGIAGNGYTYDYTARSGVDFHDLDDAVAQIIGPA